MSWPEVVFGSPDADFVKVQWPPYSTSQRKPPVGL
jgi:hypothetical protein